MVTGRGVFLGTYELHPFWRL